ncbi:MAG: hypothetical protein JW719_10150 [Pirellulales bacterium]|nr:hypothetical protein [Pirellulales bacterium]
MIRILLSICLIGGLTASSALAGAALPLEGDAYDYNGTRVDISGDTILVGGCCGGAGETGWAQVFVYSDASGQWQWDHQQTLTPADSGSSYFGYGVGLDGDTAVVGAYGSNQAHVFTRVNDVWSESATPLVHVGAGGFGYDARIDDGYVIVGTWSSNTAYVFGEGMIDGQSLSASGVRKKFGQSVAISATAAMVGDWEANTAYVYRYHYDELTGNASWIEEAALAGGSGSDKFGGCVAIDGDYVIVGAEGANHTAGSAAIYHREGAAWVEQTLLVPNELVIGDRFGSSVAISGDVAVVGAVNQGPFGARSGSVYAFERVGDVWFPSAKLLADDGVDGDEFGNAVAIDDDWIVVGAWNHDEGKGAAYVFETPSLTLIPGDANLDHQVDDDDAIILANHWGMTSDMQWTDGDFNNDHAVDAADAAILAAQWGVGVAEATSPAPEPGAAVLLAGAIAFLAAWRIKTRNRS